MGIDVERLMLKAGHMLTPGTVLRASERQALADFAHVVRAEVLEEAAKVCESQAERFTQGSPLEGNKPYAAHECAAAIRALAKELE